MDAKKYELVIEYLARTGQVDVCPSYSGGAMCSFCERCNYGAAPCPLPHGVRAFGPPPAIRPLSHFLAEAEDA